MLALLDEARQAECLRLQLFLSEEGLLESEASLQVQLEPGGKPQHLALRPGLNDWDLQRQRDPEPWLVPSIDGHPLVKPVNPQDQRQLLAVLNDLSVIWAQSWLSQSSAGLLSQPVDQTRGPGFGRLWDRWSVEPLKQHR